MRKIVFLLFIFAFSSVPAFSQINEILKRMNDHQKALKSLRAEISIDRTDAQAGEKYLKEGKLLFQPSKPDYNLRIDSIKPTPENLLVYSGKYVIYQPEPSPIFLPTTKTAYTGKTSDLPPNLFFLFSLLANPPKEKLTSENSIIYTGEEKLNGITLVWHFKLTPKVAGNYQNAELWINGDGMILLAKTVEKNGDTTTVSLTKPEKNVKLTGTDFTIELAKGTKVVSNL